MFNWRSYAPAKEQVQYKFTKIVLSLRDRHENANIFASFPPVRPTSKQSNNLYVFCCVFFLLENWDRRIINKIYYIIINRCLTT